MPSITLPPHAIHSYRWSSHPATAAAVETDRLQTTLATPADHADAQALLRAARLQSAPPQGAQAAQAAAQAAVQGELQGELQTRLGALQQAQQALPARAPAATAGAAAAAAAAPGDTLERGALPAAAAPGQHGLGVAALWAVPLGLLVPLLVAAALRRRRWQPLPAEASRASPWAVADYLPTAAVEAPEEGAAYLEFAPTR